MRNSRTATYWPAFARTHPMMIRRSYGRQHQGGERRAETSYTRQKVPCADARVVYTLLDTWSIAGVPEKSSDNLHPSFLTSVYYRNQPFCNCYNMATKASSFTRVRKHLDCTA